MCRAVLFDLDGVLVDSESRYTEFWDGIDRCFPTGVDDFAMAIKGTNLDSILRYFPEPQVKADVLKAIHDFEDTVDFEFYPGARELLEELRRADVPTAIVTSSDDVKMDCLYGQHPWIVDTVDEVVNGSMVTASKPDPQGYLLAASRLGVDAADCCVVEDSLQGLEAGRRAGAVVVGIATTYPRCRLDGLADLVVDLVSELSASRLMGLLHKEC